MNDIIDTDAYKWTAVARDAEHRRPILGGVLLHPDGYLAAADGFRFRWHRYAFIDGLERPMTIKPDGTEIEGEYPRTDRLFPEADIMGAINFAADQVRAYLDILIAKLKEYGIERRDADDDEWFENQQEGPATGGVLTFAITPERIMLKGRSSRIYNGMRDGVDVTLPAVDLLPIMLDGATFTPDAVYEQAGRTSGRRKVTLDAWFVQDALDWFPVGSPAVAMQMNHLPNGPVRFVARPDRCEVIMPIDIDRSA